MIDSLPQTTTEKGVISEFIIKHQDTLLAAVNELLGTQGMPSISAANVYSFIQNAPTFGSWEIWISVNPTTVVVVQGWGIDDGIIVEAYLDSPALYIENPADLIQ